MDLTVLDSAETPLLAGRRRTPEFWWGPASPSPVDPKGKASPESGGLSRTVQEFSHNQTNKQSCTEQRKGPLSSNEKEGGEEEDDMLKLE